MWAKIEDELGLGRSAIDLTFFPKGTDAAAEGKDLVGADVLC
jgi:hypothetical protein